MTRENPPKNDRRGGKGREMGGRNIRFEAKVSIQHIMTNEASKTVTRKREGGLKTLEITKDCRESVSLSSCLV